MPEVVRASSRYGRALRETLRTTAAAYGYTLSTATTLALLTSTHGTPHEGELFLFIFGALIGFSLLELVLTIGGAQESADDSGEGPVFPFAGALNCFSVPAALGSAVGIAHVVHTKIAWLIAPFASTAVYLATVALQVHAVKKLRG
jgi:hypothetical protein